MAFGPPPEDETLAHLMLAQRLDAVALTRARAQARAWGMTIHETLVADGAISPRDWAEAVAAVSGLPLADLVTNPCDASLLDHGERTFYLANGVIPWRREEDHGVVLAAVRPMEPEVLAWAEAEFPGVPIRWAVTAKFDILWTLQHVFDHLADLAAREALYLFRPRWCSPRPRSSSPPLSPRWCCWAFGPRRCRR